MSKSIMMNKANITFILIIPELRTLLAVKATATKCHLNKSVGAAGVATTKKLKLERGQVLRAV